MARESKKNKRARAEMACEIIESMYPNAQPALDHSTAFTLTIAVLLSAQTTDAQVNKVTPELFRRWPDASHMASATPEEIMDVIKSIGFYRVKAKHCVECARKIMVDYNGSVPQTMEELLTLPGVGRKTANIVLNVAFGIVDGIAVDTHVYRIGKRLKLTNATTPAAAERDLLDVIDEDRWKDVNSTWIRFGRDVCDAKKPKCDICEMARTGICPSAFKC